MTEEFKIAIEGLYTTFSPYPSRASIQGCPCCVSQSDKAELHSKLLRQLEEKDISRYAFKAMTTWGMSWTMNFEDKSFKNFIEFISNYYENLVNGKNSFEEIDKDSRVEFIDWIKNKKLLIEQGFFHFEKTNATFATEISDALYILEITN